MSKYILYIGFYSKYVFVIQGDELVTTCVYKTKDRLNATVGGFTFADEMCVNYVHYFPKTEQLEICKSAISNEDLDQYFHQLNEYLKFKINM